MAEEKIVIVAITAYRCDECGEGSMILVDAEAPEPSIDLVDKAVWPHECTNCGARAMFTRIYDTRIERTN